MIFVKGEAGVDCHYSAMTPLGVDRGPRYQNNKFVNMLLAVQQEQETAEGRTMIAEWLSKKSTLQRQYARPPNAATIQYGYREYRTKPLLLRCASGSYAFIHPVSQAWNQAALDTRKWLARS